MGIGKHRPARVMSLLRQAEVATGQGCPMANAYWRMGLLQGEPPKSSALLILRPLAASGHLGFGPNAHRILCYFRGAIGIWLLAAGAVQTRLRHGRDRWIGGWASSRSCTLELISCLDGQSQSVVVGTW